MQTFYQGLTESLQIIIDATAQGSFMSKTPADAYALIEKMATNNYQWHGERNQPRYGECQIGYSDKEIGKTKFCWATISGTLL